MSIWGGFRDFLAWCCGGRKAREHRERMQHERLEAERAVQEVRQSFEKIRDNRLDVATHAATLSLAANDMRRTVDDVVARLNRHHRQQPGQEMHEGP